MVDVVPADVRSRMMAGIKGINTKPELIVRKGLHARGYRYRLHVRTLPGKPDLVLARYRAIIFVHGCFWHGHDCHLFKWPSTRPEFWRGKIARNKETDSISEAALMNAGWRVAIVWQCALLGRTRIGPPQAIQRLATWVESDSETIVIRGG